MKFLLAILGAAVAYSSLAKPAVILSDSTSPDGRYTFRLLDSGDMDGTSNLELREKKTNKVVGLIPDNGYGDFPYNGLKENLTIKWSPDSSHVAITQRGTKRTWSTSVFSISKENITPVDLPNFEDYIFARIKAKESFRFYREMAIRWIDADSLEVELLGDATVSQTLSIIYDTEVIVSISSKKVREFKPLSIKPEEG